MDYVWWALWVCCSTLSHPCDIPTTDLRTDEFNDTILKELGYRQELDEDPAQMSLDDFMEEE